MAIDIIGSPPPPDWPRRIAAATFVLLFAFGLTLLVFPDFANEMNERTAGGRVLPLEAVTITESKRTSEEQTNTTGGSSTRATNRRVPTNVSSNNGSGQSGPSRVEKNSETSRDTSSDTTGDVQTTTTETIRPTRDEGFAGQAFAVPALFVLIRTAAVALISFLVAAFVFRIGGGRSRTNPQPPPPQPNPAAQDDEENPGEDPPPVDVPIVELVTPRKASEAKDQVLEGIPLLREIFATRGEPVIENTLPDMRIQIQLTDEVTKEQPLPVSLLVEDPAIAVAAFRTELEQRIRRLSRDATAQTSPSVDSILRQLVEEGLFQPQAAEGFRDLLRLTERALHGAGVDPAMTAWVRNAGVPLLMALDLMLPS